MRILVMGGSWFDGRAVVKAAHARGHDVTVFNRGHSPTPPGAVERVVGDRTNPADLARLARSGRWDAVIDVPGVIPRQVGSAAAALEPGADRYLLVSSVSAYRDWPRQPVREQSPVHPDADPDADPESWTWGSGAYGRLKAGAEAALARVFPADRRLMVRPVPVLGPGEYGGRLTGWLRRAAAGGSMLAPGTAEDPLRPVDVHDLAAFMIGLLDQHAAGIYNVAGPAGRDTWGGFLRSCLAVTGSAAEPVWVDGRWLEEHGVRQWTELPMWRTAPGTWQIDTARAEAAGLVCRPLAQTVADTWAWLAEGGTPVNGDREAMHGMDAARERDLLARWARTPPAEG